MTTMNCGCKIISDAINFEKRVYDDNSRILDIINLPHKYQQYVDVCGNCERKATLFNDFEKTKLNLAKEQFKVLTEEYATEPEPETNPED